MSNGESTRPNKFSGSPTVVAALVLVVYVFCPHVFLLPIVLMNGDRSKPPPAWMLPTLTVVFYPIRYGIEHIPPYAWLIQKESELTGVR